MAINNSVSNDFWSRFVDRINIFDFRLSGVIKKTLFNIHFFKRQEIFHPLYDGGSGWGIMISE